MILRQARAEDSPAFEAFDLGDTSEPFLGEVAEIVDGLWGWVSDPTASEHDRVVLVAEEEGELVGVIAHHLLVDEIGDVIDGHRYLMVTAIQRRYQRSGYATAVVEAVLDDLRGSGVRTVDWLVHPRNQASIAFSCRTFPMADESSPPEDQPYVRFLLSL